jgi:hypothetical protein
MMRKTLWAPTRSIHETDHASGAPRTLNHGAAVFKPITCGPQAAARYSNSDPLPAGVSSARLRLGEILGSFGADCNWIRS